MFRKLEVKTPSERRREHREMVTEFAQSGSLLFKSLMKKGFSRKEAFELTQMHLMHSGLASVGRGGGTLDDYFNDEF